MQGRPAVPFHRPCIPHCRAGVHARRGSLRRVEHFGFAQTLPRKALRYHKPPSGGQNCPPYKVPASGRRHTNVSRPPGPPAGRCKHRPLRRGGLPSPFHRPCAPHCRAGVHARRGSLRRGNISVLHRRCPAKPCDAANPKRRAKSPALQSLRNRGAAPASASPCQARRRAGRVLVRPGAAPLRRLRRHLPLQGRLYGQLPLKKAPLQGELAAPQGAA